MLYILTLGCDLPPFLSCLPLIMFLWTFSSLFKIRQDALLWLMLSLFLHKLSTDKQLIEKLMGKIFYKGYYKLTIKNILIKPIKVVGIGIGIDMIPIRN